MASNTTKGAMTVLAKRNSRNQLSLLAFTLSLWRLGFVFQKNLFPGKVDSFNCNIYDFLSIICSLQVASILIPVSLELLRLAAL